MAQIQKIQSITSAFSQEPDYYRVNGNFNMMGQDGKWVQAHIKRFELEKVQTGVDTHEMMYVGYDEKNRKLFQYLMNSVNVHYYYEEEQLETPYCETPGV